MKKFLLFSLVFFASNVSAQQAIVCDDCHTIEAAERFAKSKANRLKCSPSPDDEFSCSSNPKVVTFVDGDSGQAYSYSVYHEKTTPWQVKADRLPLTFAQEEAYEKLMKFINDLDYVIRETSTNIEDLMSGSASSSASSFAKLSSDDSCPTGTALDYLTNPNLMNDLQLEIELRVGAQLISRDNAENPSSTKKTFSLIIPDTAIPDETQVSSRAASYIASFNVSEIPSSTNDALVFDVDFIAVDANNIPRLEFGLSKASQIASFDLDLLESGPMPIDNKCVRQKLAEAVTNGFIKGIATPMGGGGADTTSDFDGLDFVTFGSSGCAIVEFSGNSGFTIRLRLCEED